MNKTALVTGATSGIGYELAKLLAKDHYNLVLVARRVDILLTIQKDFEEKYKIRVLNIPGDLSHPHFVPTIFEVLSKQNIPIDVLINNAGFGVWGPFSRADGKKQRDLVEVNITALMQLTRVFLPGMISRKEGRILNISSTAAFQPGPLMATYYATKAFVLSFSLAVNNELEGSGVTLTTLCPGPTQSNFQSATGVAHIKLFSHRGIPTSAEVALCGYKAMLKGRPVAVYGFMNNLMAKFAKILPQGFVIKLARNLQEGRSLSK